MMKRFLTRQTAWRKHFFILVLSIVSMLPVCRSQAYQSWTSAEIFLALKKLNVLGTVLYVAAHPDDENTRLIAYFSKEKLYRTGYLSVTRGDGGQNLIGNEQGIELGLIRTQELLSARNIDGGEQFFTRAFDFGFSKSPEETFSKWNKDKILADVVWVIRKFKPDIIVTRFPTTGEGGHGHHTASAILANEAFTAAADPKRFPEQIKLVEPWQAGRILWNTFNFGGINTVSPDQFKVDVGGYNPLLGKSLGEIAAESRSQHKSQGFGVPSSRGESFESFKTTGGKPPVGDLMDGIDVSWKRVKGGVVIQKMIADLTSQFDLVHPEKSVPGLVKLYKAIESLPDGYWKNKKRDEVKTLIEKCSGLFLDATTSEHFAVQTDSIRIQFSINNRLGSGATLHKVSIDGFDSIFQLPLDKNKNLNFSKTLYVPAGTPLTQPYWLEQDMEEGYFNVTDQTRIGQPDVDAAFYANIEINIHDQPFTFRRPVKYKFTDPVKGELYEPLTVIPPFDVFIPEELTIQKAGAEKNKEKTFLIRANKSMDEIQVQLGGQLIPAGEPLKLQKGQSRELQFPLPKHYSGSKSAFSEELPVTYAGSDIVARSIREVKYDHIPYINYFRKAISREVVIDLEIRGQQIGYIPGAGDKVPEALEQMGYQVTLLTDKELSRNHLEQFDAILTGVRAYNTNEWMGDYYNKLMQYVEQGGNLIVQYNTSNFISRVRSRMGPYEFDISRTRVTDENSPVVFLKPDHPVLNFPHKITRDDFNGWVQERSVYHASGWSKEFEPILSLQDPGEKPDDGSLIIAKHGKGYFTYTGLVFFRELPAGVPGAYRLLANLIALNKKKAF